MKINLGAIPVEKTVVIGPLTYQVADQGDFTFYLRQPDFPQLLAIEAQAEALMARLMQPIPGHPDAPPRYPAEFLLPISSTLCRSVALILGTLCDAQGKQLAGDDAYTEDNVFRMSKLAGHVFADLAGKAAGLCSDAETRLGNALGGREAPSSAAASTTAPSTTPTPLA